MRKQSLKSPSSAQSASTTSPSATAATNLQIQRPSPALTSKTTNTNNSNDTNNKDDNVAASTTTVPAIRVNSSSSTGNNSNNTSSEVFSPPLHYPRFPLPATSSSSSNNTPKLYNNKNSGSSIINDHHEVDIELKSLEDKSTNKTTTNTYPPPQQQQQHHHHQSEQETASTPKTNSNTPKTTASKTNTNSKNKGVSIIWNTTEEEDDEWYRQQIEYVRTQVEQLGKKDINREQEANSIRSEWKRELFLLFEDPSSSRRAFWVNIFVTIMIIFSAVLSTIETIPSMREGHPHLWFNLEALVVVIFTIEFILRACGHSGTVRQFFRHILSFLTIVDIVAIVPFYIELMLKKDTSYEFRFTILRILRLLRVFSAFKYSSLLQLSIEVMIVSFKRSADALMALLLFSVLIIVLFSTLMYFAERGVWDENSGAFLDPSGEYSQFTSIPAAAWYMAVTLTTTGFGDMTPKTFVGKLISFPAMMCGILLIALPSIIVGRNFTQVWEAARKYRGVGKPNQRSQVMPDGTVVVDDQVGGPLVTGSSLSAGGSTSHTPRSGGVVIGAANSSMRNRRHTDSLVGTGEGASGKSRASINNRSKVHNDNISLALQKTRNDNWDVDRSLSSRRGFDPIKEFSRRGSFEIDNDETLFDHPSGYKPLENDDEAADDYKGKSRDDDGLNISYDGSKDTSSAEDQVVVIAKKEWQQLQVEFETLKQSNKETRQLLEQILEIVAADKNQQLAQASEQ